MLTDARFEARHQIADLAPHLTLDPVGMNGTISEEVAMPRTDRGTRHGECRFRHRAVALDRDPRRRAHRMLRHAGRLSHRRAVAQDHPDVAIDSIEAVV